MPAQRLGRLQSLDAFRGITIAGMLLVNTNALSATAHPWLTHAYWNGCHFADLIFPFFLFITGISAAFSLAKYVQKDRPKWEAYARVVRRSLTLFLLGLTIDIVGAESWEHLRLTGVLQRISVAYFASALIILNASRRGQRVTAVLLLLVYWVAYLAFPVTVPNLQAHIPSGGFATFGLLSLFSLLPAITTVLVGYFTGVRLRSTAKDSRTQPRHQSFQLAIAGFVITALGYFWGFILPINKKIWTSSYALLTIGLALLLLSLLYELIEVRGFKRWSQSLQVLGLNPIAVFMGSEIMIQLLRRVHLGSEQGSITIYLWLEKILTFTGLSVTISGLLLALIMLTIWWSIAYLLYQRNYFISV
jgi:predicted acyltransferase